MERHNCVKHLDLNINVYNLEEGITQLITNVRPEWRGLPFKTEVLTGGYTNRLFAISLDKSPNDRVLVHIYGNKTELFIDRNKLQTMAALHKSGLIPPVYCSFNNGISYGYSSGIVLNINLVRDPLISRLISETFARIHTLVFENELGHQGKHMHAQPSLFITLRKFLDLIPGDKYDNSKCDRLKTYFPNKESLVSEVNHLESCLKGLSSRVVFCHNDLLPKNIIFDSMKSSITFIDFEFSDHNFQAFDIGNHFCEFCGIESYDPTLYPNKDFQISWIRHYLQTFKELKGEFTSDEFYFEEEVQNLYNSVQYYAVAAHLFWALLEVVYFINLDLQDDSLGCALDRFQQYFENKPILKMET